MAPTDPVIDRRATDAVEPSCRVGATSTCWRRSAMAAVAATLLAAILATAPALAGATAGQGVAQPAATGELAFVQGLPDHEVDVYLGDARYLSGFELGQRTIPEPFEGGGHWVSVYETGADPDVDPPLVEELVDLPAGDAITVVIGAGPGSVEGGEGDVATLTVFDDDLAPTTAGTTDLVVRNAAEAGAVGLEVDGHVLLDDIAPGGQGLAPMESSERQLSLVVPEVAIDFDPIELVPGTQLQVYLVGASDVDALIGVLFQIEVGQTPVFTDVPVDHPFFDSISWARVRGIAEGYPDDRFLPADPVSRQAGTAFLYRSAGEPEGAEPVCESAPFTDVPVDHPFCGEIAWAAGAGITGGYDDGSFQPAGDISRQAMSSFLYRYAGSPRGENPACATPPFTDVPVDHPFCGEISWMSGAGIASGYDDGTFQPARTVSRQAATSFLQAVADLPEPEPEADAPADAARAAGAPATATTGTVAPALAPAR